MSYPISPSQVERGDLTESACHLYDGLRRAGQEPGQAMQALFQICAEEGGARHGRSSMRLPTLQKTRERAARRIAKTMVARGKPKRSVQNATGVSSETVRVIKRELDEEMAAEHT